MKKWFMLPLLPLLPLLLVQREAGATMFASSGQAGSSTYTATFHADDDPAYCQTFLNDFTHKFSMCLNIQFTNTDLNAAKNEKRGETVLPTSLIGFYLTDESGTSTPVTIVDLKIAGGKVLVVGPSNLADRTINTVAETITGGCFTVPDPGNCGLGSPEDLYTFMKIVGSNSSNSSKDPITEVSVPVANSLMLLGIGLTAMRARLRRSKLS